MIQSNSKKTDSHTVLTIAASAAIQTLLWVGKLLLLLIVMTAFSVGVALISTHLAGGVILAGVLILWLTAGRPASPYLPPSH